jgi:hypothetical protein
MTESVARFEMIAVSPEATVTTITPVVEEKVQGAVSGVIDLSMIAPRGSSSLTESFDAGADVEASGAAPQPTAKAVRRAESEESKVFWMRFDWYMCPCLGRGPPSWWVETPARLRRCNLEYVAASLVRGGERRHTTRDSPENDGISRSTRTTRDIRSCRIIRSHTYDATPFKQRFEERRRPTLVHERIESKRAPSRRTPV